MLAAIAPPAGPGKISVLYIDLEAQYQVTIDHVDELIRCTADVVDAWYWVTILSLRNAASAIRPKWICWDKNRRKNGCAPSRQGGRDYDNGGQLPRMLVPKRHGI
ncbi:MAG: hypothetical protein ACLVLH_25480 [Eisenbergiella massiliensis]